MNLLKIPAGSSADLSITVTDPSNSNAPLDMSEAIGIVIVLYDAKEKSWGFFSMNSIAGYEDIDMDDAAEGILKIKILEEQTVLSAIGKFFIDMKITFSDAAGSETDSNFILAKKEIGVILDSKVKSINTHPTIS